jgi:hypothetical protein
MKTVNSWNDIEPYGIVLLTGEACGLGYRLLCDVTERGRKTLEKCLGMTNLVLPESRNRGKPGDSHVGSIMLVREMLQPIAVFALLEAGCKEVYLVGDSVVGMEESGFIRRMRAGASRVQQLTYDYPTRAYFVS